MRKRNALRGIIQTAGVVAAFVQLGLGFAVARQHAANLSASPYTAVSMPQRSEGKKPPQRWLIDGFNVLHVALLRGRERGEWWGPEARTRLLAAVSRFDDPGSEICVVFDGSRPLEAPEASAGPRVVFARSADAWLLAEVRAASEPGLLTVVTADRKLADRARHRGARIVSPRDFLQRCREKDQPA